MAGAIDLDPYKGKFEGERVYARIEAEDMMKARTLREAVDKFCEDHPRIGEELQQYIEDERSVSETHLYFGINEGCRLTADDYIGVMTGMGFTEITARKLYPELMEVSRKMSRKRKETERSVLIG